MKGAGLFFWCRGGKGFYELELSFRQVASLGDPMGTWERDC